MKKSVSIYAIGAENGPVKIGISSSPLSRLAKIRTSCPFEIKLWGTLALPNRDEALQVESCVHEAYCDHRATGEWFEIDAEQAIEAIETAVETHEYFKINGPTL